MRILIIFSALSMATSSVATKPIAPKKEIKIGTAQHEYTGPMYLFNCQKGKIYSLLVAGEPNGNGRQGFLFRCIDGKLIVPESVWPIRP